MRDRLPELGDTTDIALVTFTDRTGMTAYSAANDLPFPVFTDPARAAYRAFGLGRGSLARVWGWRAARRYVQIVRAEGRSRLARPTEDTLQLGGDFVIGPDGRLRYGYWGTGPDDRPSVDELIEAIGRIET